MTAHSASLISEGETRPRVLRLIPPGQHRHATPSVACAHAGNDAGTGGTRYNGMKAPGPCDPDSTPVQVPGASYRCAAGAPAGVRGRACRGLWDPRAGQLSRGCSEIPGGYAQGLAGPAGQAVPR